MSESLPNQAPDDTPLRREPADAALRRDDEELFLRKMFALDPGKGMDMLFRTYYTPLCSHAVRFVYSRQVAEDLVSEVFFQFYRTEAYQHVHVSYIAYLFRAVRNEAFSYLKREFGKTTALEARHDAQQPDGQVQPDMELHYNHLYRKVSETVAQLPAQCRRVFLMSRFENKKYHEIAEELNISPKTVEVHVSKALRFLRQHLRSGWLSLLPFLFY